MDILKSIATVITIGAVMTAPLAIFWWLYRKYLAWRRRKTVARQSAVETSAPEGERLHFEYYTLAIVTVLIIVILFFGWLASVVKLSWINWGGAAGVVLILGGFAREALSRAAFERALEHSPAWTRGAWIWLNLLFHVIVPLAVIGAIGLMISILHGK